MTEFPVLLVLNALWAIGIVDGRVRASLAEQNASPDTSRTLRGVSAVLVGVLVYLLLQAVLPAVADVTPRADRVRLFWFKLGAIGCVVVGIDLALRYLLKVSPVLANRQTLVNGLVGLSLLFVYPIQDNLRLGIDLAGGTQLIYQVKFSEDAVPDQKIETAERILGGIQQELTGKPTDPAAAKKDLETVLEGFAEALGTGKALPADQAAKLKTRAEELSSKVRSGETATKADRVRAMDEWLADAARQVKAASDEASAKTAKELDDLNDKLSRMQDSTVNRDRAIEDLIETLKRRVDPASVLGLVWAFEGDRLTIQMPAPKKEIADLRRVWNDKRAAVERGNVDVADVLQDVKSAAAGNKEAAARLDAAIVRHKDSPEREKAVVELKDAAAELLKAQGGSATAKDAAEKRFNAAVTAVEKGNLPIQPLEEALRLPVGRDSQKIDIDYAKALLSAEPPADPKVAADPRFKALAKLRSGTRVAELADAVKAYDDYRGSVKSSIEDVDDLKRELRGAGVLSFHIIPDQIELSPAARRAAEQQLTDRGLLKPVPVRDPQTGAVQPGTENLSKFRWFKADDEEWQSKGGYDIYPPLGAEPLRGHRYILAWDADNYGPDGKRVRRMTFKSVPQEPWKLTRVGRTMDEAGASAVSFNFDENGGAYFGELTGANIGRLMMIVVDERAITAPSIRSVIHGSGQITGRFSDQEIQSLIRKLSAGSLRARLSDLPISEQTVGSTLGADNQRKGLAASVWSLVIVGVFIGVYYRLGGLIAVLALVFNVVLLLGALVSLNASMTLPGIAGLVLTIGIAVDYNVLIFERIREERDNGVPLKQAIRNGYERAWSAIIDSNLTTIITCLILAWVGTGDVKSFGIVLLLGVTISMFTALFATRVILDILTSRNLLTDMHFMHLIRKPRINWMSLLPIFLTFSALANLWATNIFFGLPLWAAALLVPAAIGVVAVTTYRHLFGPNWLYLAAAMAVGSTALPILARFGMFGGDWDTAATVFGLAGAALAACVVGWLWSRVTPQTDPTRDGKQHWWERASFAGITLAALTIVAGVTKVFVAGAPKDNFDIEFSTGTAVQLAFKPERVKKIEQVRDGIRELGESLKGAAVAPAGVETYEISLGAPLASRPKILEVKFAKEKFPTVESVQDYVRHKAAEKLGGSSVQALEVAGEQINSAGERQSVVRTQYQVKTMEDNLLLVDGAMRSLFTEDLDVQEKVRTAGKIAVSPVPAAELDRGLVGADANSPYYHEFQGGVLLRPGRFEAPQKLEDVEKRIAREINRGGGGGGGGSDNIVTVFKVVPGERAGDTGGYWTVEVLGRGPPDTPRLPAGTKADSAEYREWERSIAAPFAKVVEGSLAKGQAFDRIVNFNPQVADQSTRAALSAVFLSWLAIIAYMWFRFGEAKWGIAGVACLVHDICIALGALLAGQFITDTWLGHMLGVDAFKIDMTAVAAVLTIIGYSIHDTIVVFDRIREVRGRAGAVSANLINDSINQTMSRTILTSFLTWLSVAVLYVFGGSGVHVFSFLMLTGIFIGTYSSIAIAAPILLLGMPVSRSVSDESDRPAKTV